MRSNTACMVVSVLASVKSKTFISYLEEETEADPLVVFMVSSFVWIKGFVHPRMCYIETDAFPERAGDGIC